MTRQFALFQMLASLYALEMVVQIFVTASVSLLIVEVLSKTSVAIILRRCEVPLYAKSFLLHARILPYPTQQAVFPEVAYVSHVAVLHEEQCTVLRMWFLYLDESGDLGFDFVAASRSPGSRPLLVGNVPEARTGKDGVV